jgi:hypothetical protein
MRKKMNKKAEEGIQLSLGNLISIVLVVLCFIVLISLAVILYNFSSSVSDQEKADAEISKMQGFVNNVIETGIEKPYIVETVKDWYIFSSEFGDLCGGSFCLCLCESPDCLGVRACRPTSRFVLLRKPDGIETRFYPLESPNELKIKLYNEEVYPFNAGIDVNIGWTVIESVTPLFFKYSDKWLWSPDLESWMSVSQKTVTGGKWNGKEPARDNLIFLDKLSKIELNNKEESQALIEKVFRDSGSKKTKVVAIQK